MKTKILLMLVCALFMGCSGKNLVGYMEGKENISAMAVAQEGKIQMVGEIYDYIFDANLTAQMKKADKLVAINEDAVIYDARYITIDKYNKNSDLAYIEHEIILKKSELPLAVQAKLLDDEEQLEAQNSSKFRFYYLSEGKYLKRLENHDEIVSENKLARPLKFDARIAIDSGKKSDKDEKMETDIKALILTPLMMPVLLLQSIF